MPKKDSEGRMYTEVRCTGTNELEATCNAWLADIYIRDGRIRLRCRRSDCGKITIMVFKPRRSKRRGQKSITKETTNG